MAQAGNHFRAGAALAAALALAPLPAWAFQDALGGLGAFLPVVVVLALGVIVFAIWNHRTRDTHRRNRKRKRRRR